MELAADVGDTSLEGYYSGTSDTATSAILLISICLAETNAVFFHPVCSAVTPRR
jgi:hypothetical protein